MANPNPKPNLKLPDPKPSPIHLTIFLNALDTGSLIQTACRGVWQNMGQNCAGPERFLVYESVFDEFSDGVARIVKGNTCGLRIIPCH